MSYKITIVNESDPENKVFEGIAQNEPTVDTDNGNVVYDTDKAVVTIDAKGTEEDK